MHYNILFNFGSKRHTILCDDIVSRASAQLFLTVSNLDVAISQNSVFLYYGRRFTNISKTIGRIEMKFCKIARNTHGYNLIYFCKDPLSNRLLIHNFNFLLCSMRQFPHLLSRFPISFSSYCRLFIF